MISSAERGLVLKPLPRDPSPKRRASDARRRTSRGLDLRHFALIAPWRTSFEERRGNGAAGITRPPFDSACSGQLAVRAGDLGGEIFVVLEGSLMEVARQKGAASDTLAVYFGGDVIGEVPFAATGARKRSVIAMEETRLLGFTVRILDDLARLQRRASRPKFSANLANRGHTLPA